MIFLYIFGSFLISLPWYSVSIKSVSAAAFRQHKTGAEMEPKYYRFAILIAARNEEVVLGSLIESLKFQNYPEGMIDIIVIADNCEDNTAKVAEQAGVIVYKRYNRAKVGKGYVIKFALDKIFEERDIYDAFCVIDADNLVDSNFIWYMNQAGSHGSVVAQGYRDMKNPADNWISGCHSIFYWMQNRFFNHARAVQGLSVTVNDTGFMFTRGYVKKYGFNMKTITEDLELSMQCVINGQKVDWVPEAKVYNEQPLSVQQSMAQRTRWVNGFIQCFLNYFRPLLSSFSKRPTGVKIDMLMFLISLPIMIMSMISKLLYALLGLFRIFDTMGTMLNLTIMGIVSAFAFWGIGFLSVALERKHPVKLKKAVLTYPIFNVMWVVLYVKYIFRHTSEWKPIIHARNISIKEMETIEK